MRRKASCAVLFAAFFLSGCDVASLLLPNNATLSSLSVADKDGTRYALSPDFSQTTLSYTTSVGATVDRLYLSATATYELATLAVTGASADGLHDTVTGTGTLAGTGPWLLDTSATNNSTTIQVLVTAKNGSATQIYSVSVSVKD